jgi:hypothetical protein
VVTAVAVLPDGHRALSPSTCLSFLSGRCGCGTSKTGAELAQFVDEEGPIIPVAASPAGDRAIIGDMRGVLVFNVPP